MDHVEALAIDIREATKRRMEFYNISLKECFMAFLMNIPHYRPTYKKDNAESREQCCAYCVKNAGLHMLMHAAQFQGFIIFHSPSPRKRLKSCIDFSEQYNIYSSFTKGN